MPSDVHVHYFGTTKQYFNMNGSWPDQLQQKSFWYGIQAHIAPSLKHRGMATILKRFMLKCYIMCDSHCL
jgi:hypothetical protein